MEWFASATRRYFPALVVGVLAACGSRSQLGVVVLEDAAAPPPPPHDAAPPPEAGVDASPPPKDAAVETAPKEAGPDASPPPPLCDPPTQLAAAADRFFALDSTWVYYTEGKSAEVRRVPKAGGSVEKLCSMTPFLGPTGGTIAVDGGNVYFVDADGIERVSTNGGTPTLLYATPTNNGIGFLATNGTYLVWTETHYQTQTVYIGRMSLPGSTATLLVQDADIGDCPLALDAQSVYFMKPGTIQTIPVTGGSETTLASTTKTAFVDAIVVDGSDVFWGDRYPQSDHIHSVSQGNQPSLLWSSTKIDPVWLAVDTTNIYMSDFDFHVYRIPRGGGAETLFVNTQAFVESLAQDATSVYWIASASGVYKCDK
jgi:hypothetical protein